MFETIMVFDVKGNGRRMAGAIIISAVYNDWRTLSNHITLYIPLRRS
jgi:hypothetical protein